MRKKGNLGLQAGIFGVIVAVFALAMFSVLLGKVDTSSQSLLSESAYNDTSQGTDDAQGALIDGLNLAPILIIGVMAVAILGSIFLMQRLM